jgi:hypothetical protein
VLEDDELDEDEAEESFVALGAALVAALALAAGLAALAAGLAANDGGLASSATAGSRERAAEQRADLAESGLMAGLSKAKVTRGSSDSADN